MASKWWLFIGCALICSGFLLPIGVIILIWYFFDFIFNKDGISTGNQCIVNLDEQNNSDIQINHMSNDVRNSMR